MKKSLIYVSVILLMACNGKTPYSEETVKSNLRAPAYPLLMLHPHVRLWSTTDQLNERNMTFTDGKALPFIGFLRVDGVMYRFMGDKGLPMQAIAPMAFDEEKWESKFTSLIPNEGWEQPDFNDEHWQIGEGAFGTPKIKEVKTPWYSPNIWVRREVNIDPYLLEHKKLYLRYSHDDIFTLYINGIKLIDTGYNWGSNFKIALPEEILKSMKNGKALIAAHCENRLGDALVDFGLFAEEPTLPVETIAPISFEGDWKGKYTLKQPQDNWLTIDFDDSAWKEGQAAFGTDDQRNIHTPWLSHDIWVRRTLQFKPVLANGRKLYLRYSHDDVFQLYINGKQLVNTAYEWRGDVRIDIPDSIAATMRDGKAVIAAHCENRMGGGLVDFGLYAELKEACQKSVDVQATQTHYTFECGEVELKLSFTSPYLLDNMEIFPQPINYISYRAKALDGKSHDVSIYFEIDPHKALDAGQTTQIYEKNGLKLMKTGKEKQQLWVNENRNTPAWGYFYIGTKGNITYSQGDAAEMRKFFMEKGDLKDMRPSDEKRYAAFAQKMNLSDEYPQHLTVAFDGLYTMSYFGENLRPYWNKEGKTTIEDVYVKAEKEYRNTMAECYAFDRNLMKEAAKAGNKEYAELCALAYRQTVSSFQLSESTEGELLYFTPQVGPIDEYYPASPLFLYYNPKLVEAMLNPFLYYSESGKWTKPFPVHDMGGYPIVNGQTYGYDMPVEEAGNVLIMIAAITKRIGNASYAEKHWQTLTTWANFLKDTGVDTGYQFSTDNFAGECPHNANLSIKGILGIASYAQLAEKLGKKEEAKIYKEAAVRMMKEWMKKANAGNHYKLAFNDSNDNWGLKYNLVWDSLLNLNIVPSEVLEKEITWYLSQMNEFGCPLDGKHTFTKADWSVWIATLSRNPKTFQRFIVPLHRFMNKTTDRTPMADLLNTDKAVIAGFPGRSVVGAYFIELLFGLWTEVSPTPTHHANNPPAKPC